jgi:hypothetical protein
MTEPVTFFDDRRAAATSGISVKLDLLHADVGDMKEAIKTLATAINRLAVVEERLGNTSQALERAFVALEKVEARLAALEQTAVTSKQTNAWVDKALWALAAAAAMYIAKKVGLVT